MQLSKNQKLSIKTKELVFSSRKLVIQQKKLIELFEADEI